ncbi:MAG: magnesium-translocating P-type ATPase [Rhodoblastus sp.]
MQRAADSNINAGGIAPVFWRVPLAGLLAELTTSAAGLTSAEAARRLQTFGPNAFEKRPRFVALRKIARKASEPLVLILAAAAAVSAATGDRTGFVTIVTILAMSIAIDVVQEVRAESAADALRKSVAVHADALRDGALVSVPTRLLAPGDVVELRAGDIVPADGVVIEARDLFVNQALLTGEPYPVEKTIAPAQTDDLNDATNGLFMGASVVSGKGRMLIVRTGAATQMGDIATALGVSEPPTAFERSMRDFGRLVVRLTSILVFVVLLAHIAFQRPLLESFLFALALAVGLTPELLPMIMTVSLSRGAMRLAKAGVIVKRLPAIHNLGAMNVLCTDKTGTLTEARIDLVRAIREDGADDDYVFELVWLNSKFETGLRSPMDDAVLARPEPADATQWRKIDEVPFDFERRRVSVLLEKEGARLLIAKGAPEDVLAHCTHVETRDHVVSPLDGAARARLLALHDSFAADGMRLLAVAWRAMAADATSCHIEDEDKLVFAGYAAFLDPPKASAADALTKLAATGVAVKVVSGDNELVVRHLARSIGLDAESFLTGAQIGKMDDAALAAAAQRTSLFCRVSPAQKTRVIQSLQARGATVGYVGDGVNDAPSLHAADVGISVESAVDVAKQAADMILTQPDLHILAEAAVEGRRTFVNISKYLLMGTSSNFGNMLSMAAASLLLPFLPMLPVQILVNNLIYDVSELGIPFDRVAAAETAAPQVWDIEALKRFTFVMGAVSSLFDLATFYILLRVFHADETMFRTAWFVESMATQILVIFIIRSRGRLFASLPHPALVASSLGALAVALALPFTPVGGWLSFAPLPAHIIASIVAIVGAYLAAAWFARRWARPVIAA